MAEPNIRAIRKDRRLHSTTKLFYVYLLDLHAERGETITLTTRELAEETQLGIGSISRAIRQLKEFGYINARKEKEDVHKGGPDNWHIEIPSITPLSAPSPPYRITIDKVDGGDSDLERRLDEGIEGKEPTEDD